MSDSVLALLLRPVLALIVVGLIAYPVRRWIQRRWADSRLKRFFLISWKV